MGAFWQQFPAIATQQLKPVIIGARHFVAIHAFTSANIKSLTVVLPGSLRDID